MEYIQLSTGKYPITEHEIRALFPNTSFPRPFQAPADYAVVFDTPAPIVDDLHIARKVSPIFTEKGVWETQWEVIDKFTEYTDKEGNVVTVDSQISAFIASKRNSLLSDLANYRYQVETGGITVNGAVIKTDRDSQATLTGAYVAVQQNPNMLIDWKSETGWIQIDKATVEALCMTVTAHVQGCFTKEKAIADIINNTTNIANLPIIEEVWANV